MKHVIEWAWAGSALDGTSGDLHAVVPFADGVLVALLDGLGHGPEAAAAAAAALPVLRAHAGEPVTMLVQRCHEAMRGTRGAVMSLASFDARTAAMTWVGVGNVAGVLLCAGATPAHAGEAIVARGGVVGYRLPPLHARTLQVAPGDLLVLATDGIRGGFSEDLPLALAPQEIAEAVLAGFASGKDDAHVVVARYLGQPE